MPFEVVAAVAADLSLCWTGLMPFDWVEVRVSAASKSARSVADMSVSFVEMCEAAGSLVESPPRVKPAPRPDPTVQNGR